jgi:hypothetical protein
MSFGLVTWPHEKNDPKRTAAKTTTLALPIADFRWLEGTDVGGDMIDGAEQEDRGEQAMDRRHEPVVELEVLIPAEI